MADPSDRNKGTAYDKDSMENADDNYLSDEGSDTVGMMMSSAGISLHHRCEEEAQMEQNFTRRAHDRKNEQSQPNDGHVC